MIIHVETQEEFDELMVALASEGYRWPGCEATHPAMRGHWEKYGAETVVLCWPRLRLQFGKLNSPLGIRAKQLGPVQKFSESEFIARPNIIIEKECGR